MRKILTVAAILLAAGLARADDTGHSCSGSADNKHSCCKKTTSASMSGDEKKMKDCCAAQSGKAADNMCSNMNKALAEKLDAAIKDAKDVELTGKLFCAACDLKTEQKCQHVFKSGDVVYYLMDSSEGMNLAKSASHGSKEVRIKAKTTELDGKKYLQVLSFEAGASAPAA